MGWRITTMSALTGPVCCQSQWACTGKTLTRAISNLLCDISNGCILSQGLLAEQGS